MSASSMKDGLLQNATNPLVSRSEMSTPSAVSKSTSPEVRVATTASTRDSAGATRLHLRTVGCPKESTKTERRVAQTPESVRLLTKKGLRVLVERGAGAEASLPDSLYAEAGAILVEREEAFAADVVVKVRAPSESEALLLRSGAALISFFYPAQNAALIEKLARRGSTVIAMDCVPRLTRAQGFDALSSMANIAGYKAVIEAAHHFGRFLGGQITAAGRIPPAKVLVVGGGVAGLAAISTAKSMGAIVRCFDTRPAVKEQVQSLGGEFLEMKGFELEEGAGGYAKDMTKEFIEAEMALFAQQAKEVDIIITTALIPGKRAPRLITKEMIETMRCGSVVVDLAAEMGGNIETTRKDEVYVSTNGVTHVGLADLPSRLSTQASRLYANNLTKFLLSMLLEDGVAETGYNSPSRNEGGKKVFRELVIDMENEVIRGCVILQGGELRWPPARPVCGPPVPVVVTEKKKKATPSVSSAAATNAKHSPLRRTVICASILTFGFLFLLAMGLLSQGGSVFSMMTVFCLAGTAGYQAVWGVAPALHTPLMSVTNAISGITAVGGLVLFSMGSSSSSSSPSSSSSTNSNTSFPGVVEVLSGLAVLASCINIAGGFLVTKRMLDMFRRTGDPVEYNALYAVPAILLVAVSLFADAFGFRQSVGETAYLAGSLCCIAGIGGLAAQKSARFGNSMGMMGVFVGVIITLSCLQWSSVVRLVLAIGLMTMGFALGLLIGRTVQITDLPQTVAGFHSLVGLAAMVTSIAHFVAWPWADVASSIAAILGDLIGGITLTGSLVAFGKLHGIRSSKALHLPGKNLLNLAFLVVQGSVIGLFMTPTLFRPTHEFVVRLGLLCVTALLALLEGWHLVDSVGGGDMPVCITVLNSYSGWALVAEGFMLKNTMLTIVGSLIGFSGGILSYIMCRAMNRSLSNVLFGGYAMATPSTKATHEKLEHRETTADETAELIVNARSVIIVPGYGMAVARAQYAICELARLCRARQISVKFAVHPVAGRMPGQMNVLLAEAGVPYDWVYEMDEVNDEFSETDLALVVGANDITNSAAVEDPTCSIAGMPVLQVWKARTCIFMKRSMAAGYADLDNLVFYKPNTLMLLGDAKKTLESLVTKIKTYWEP